MPPSKLKQAITLFISVAIGSMIAKAFTYPWSGLQLPMPGDYSEYELAKMSYDRYEEKHGEKPHDLSFLPQDMIHDIGKPGYPITYDVKTGKISYSNASSPYYFNKRDLIDYIFGRNGGKVLGTEIGTIEPAKSRSEN